MFEIKQFDLVSTDIQKFSEMYKKCLNQTVDYNYFKWKYIDNPAGELIGYLALDGGNIAGFYGVIPEKYIVDGQQITIFQSMDTMTHPDYQKRGLFTLLAKKTYETILNENSSALIIGIPGSNSYHGFVNKLQWNHIHSFSYIFLPKYLFKLLNLFNNKKTSIQTINTFSTLEIKAFLFKYNNSNSGIKPYIDDVFLNWRIKEHPFKKYNSITININEKIIGLAIYYITESNNCFIEWLMAEENDKLKKVISVFCEYIFMKHKTNNIYTWKPNKSKASKQFKSLGFITNPLTKGPFSYKIPFIVFTKNNRDDLLHIDNYDLQPIIQD